MAEEGERRAEAREGRRPVRLVASRHPHARQNDIKSSRQQNSRTESANRRRYRKLTAPPSPRPKARHAVRWAGARRPRVAAADAADAAAEGRGRGRSAHGSGGRFGWGGGGAGRRPPAAVGSTVDAGGDYVALKGTSRRVLSPIRRGPKRKHRQMHQAYAYGSGRPAGPSTGQRRRLRDDFRGGRRGRARARPRP